MITFPKDMVDVSVTSDIQERMIQQDNGSSADNPRNIPDSNNIKDCIIAVPQLRLQPLQSCFVCHLCGKLLPCRRCLIKHTTTCKDKKTEECTRLEKAEEDNLLKEKYKAIETELEEFKEERSKVEEILQTELQLVGEALDSVNKEVDETRKQIDSLRHTLLSLVSTRAKQESNTLIARIGELEKTLSSKKEYVTELNKSLQGAKRELEEHKQETEEQIKDYQSQLNALDGKKITESENTHLIAKFIKHQEELQNQKNRLEAENDELKTELNKVQKDFESEKKELVTVNDKLNVQLNKVQKGFECEKKQLVSVNDKIRTRLNKFQIEFESEKNKLVTMNDKLKTELKTVQKDLESEKKKLETADGKLKTECNRFETELESEKKKLINENAKLKNVLHVLNELQSEKKKLETDNDKLKNELIEVQKELLGEKKKIETFQTEHKSEVKKIKNESTSEKKLLEDLNSQLKDEVAKHIEKEKNRTETIESGSNTAVTKLHEELQNEKKQLESVNLEIKTEIVKLKVDFEIEKKSMVREQCEMKADVTKLQEESYAKDKQIKDLTESLKSKRELEIEKQIAKEELKKTMSQLEHLKLMLHQNNDKIRDMDETANSASKPPTLNRNTQSDDDVIILKEITTHQDKEETVKQLPTPDCDKDAHTDDYKKLVDYGLNKQVADKLEEIYKTGNLLHTDIEEWVLDGLKEFSVEATIDLLTGFLDGTFQVSDIYGHLCNYVKNHQEKKVVKMTLSENNPNEERIKLLLCTTGCSLKVAATYREYGGPVPGCQAGSRDVEYEVEVTNIPSDVYEDELVPIFNIPAKIWNIRLMTDPTTRQHTGQAFVMYSSREQAEKAVKHIENFRIRAGKRLIARLSVPGVRLLVGNIPLNITEIELYQSFGMQTDGLLALFFFHPYRHDDTLCGNFRVLEYDSFTSVLQAKLQLENPQFRFFNNKIIVDWHDPEVDKNVDISREKGLFIKNMPKNVSDQLIRIAFERFGKVEVIVNGPSYTFVHYARREDAITAMEVASQILTFGTRLNMRLTMSKWDNENADKLAKRRLERMKELMGRLHSSVPGDSRESSKEITIVTDCGKNYKDKSSCVSKATTSDKKNSISFQDLGSNYKKKSETSNCGDQPSNSDIKNCAKRKLESEDETVKKRLALGPTDWDKDTFEGVTLI